MLFLLRKIRKKMIDNKKVSSYLLYAVGEVFLEVLRHELDYSKAAVKGDTLICTTWVEEAEGVKMPRIVEIKNEKEELIAKARTIWCALDGATLRPERIQQDLFEKFK